MPFKICPVRVDANYNFDCLCEYWGKYCWMRWFFNRQPPNARRFGLLISGPPWDGEVFHPLIIEAQRGHFESRWHRGQRKNVILSWLIFDVKYRAVKINKRHAFYQIDYLMRWVSVPVSPEQVREAFTVKVPPWTKTLVFSREKS